MSTRISRALADRGVQLDFHTLPPLPDVALRILKRFGDEFIDGNEVADVVERDPAICARLTGLANSAYFNLRRPATDMRDIVNRVLGVDTVRSLAFALATQRAFDTSRCPSFDTRRYWRSALTTGDGCSRIASVVDDLSETQRDLAYTFGLCHSLGLLALACEYPDRLDGVLSVEDADDDLDARVLAEFGASIGEVTLIIAERWSLPDVMREGYRAIATGSPGNDMLATVLTAARRASEFEHVTSDNDEVSWTADYGIDVAKVRRVVRPSERQLASIESTVNMFVD